MDKEEESLVGMEMVFKNVCVNIGNYSILADVSGLARTGQILAIMGPPGNAIAEFLRCLY